MGGEGHWTWDGRGGSPLLPLPCPWLSPSGTRPTLLTRMSLCCLVVARGLAGGCHIAQIQTVLGAAGGAGIPPGSTLCPARGVQLSSCLAPAWHGKEEALSPLSARENCLLLPPCQAWLQELALAPAVQGELWCQQLALGER